MDGVEVRQDGKIQKLLFAQFVPVLSAAPSSAASPDVGAAALPATPRGTIRRQDVQRTLAIVVDDLSLSFESFQNAKRALHAFIDRELRPTDLVALVRTGGSIGALQPFTVDRRILHASIDRLRWNGMSRNGVESYLPVNTFMTFDERTGIGDLSDFELVEILRRSMSAQGTFGALNLVVQGARDLPGRKAVVFVSEGFQLLSQGAHDNQAEPNSRLRRQIDRVIEQATRAGVVIYAGLSRTPDDGAAGGRRPQTGPLLPGGMDEVVRDKELAPTEVQPRHAGGHGVPGRADRWLRGAEHQ